MSAGVSPGERSAPAPVRVPMRAVTLAVALAVALSATCALVLRRHATSGARSPGYSAAVPPDAPPLRAVAPVGRTTALGVSLDAFAADPWENPAAAASAHRVLAASPVVQAQSIMGWGTPNPEPSPGVYDWSGLDRRVATIVATRGTPVLILAGAPDWMAGGTPGSTDWSKLGQAPTPDHFEDFAALAATIARRYPAVHSFEVWKELAGFWDQNAGQWDIADYTDLYNDVYQALKAVNPTIQVGGPYIALTSSAVPSSAPGALSGPWGTVDPRGLEALGYWLSHAAGADFVAVDANDQPTDGPSHTDDFTATGKFAAIDHWLEARARLPIWWSELYVQSKSASWTPQQQAAVYTAGLTSAASSGASLVFLWGPEADGDGTHRAYLWTDATRAGGGQPSPLAASLAGFARYFGPGSTAGGRASVTIDQRPPYTVTYRP